jgi:L-fuconolactonase
MSTPPPLVDAHLHLWDRSRFDYPWMSDLPALPHASLPEDIASSFAGAVVIEAGAREDQTSAEVTWLSELSHRFPTIWGVVAAVDLTDPRLGEVLAELRENPLAVGVRDNLEGLPLGDLGSPSRAPLLRRGIIAVLEAELTFDICVRSAQLPELTGLLKSIAEVRGSAAGLVIDHLGKPLPEGPVTDRGAWAESMVQLADLPGLHMKFSGLPGQVPGDVDVSGAHELVRDHLDIVDAFGAGRTMFGTDHPVSTLAHGLQPTEWTSAASAELGNRFSTAELAAICSTTAIDFYGLRRRE